MKYDDLIKYYGSAELAGDAIGFTRQGVFRWKNHEIPIAQQIDYEVHSKGALLADIPKQLRRRAA